MMNTPSSQTSRERLWYLDLLRIAATLAIVCLHVSPFVGLDISSPDWQIANVYNTLCRFAVPVFFMISGALFLSPQHELSPRRIFTKSLPRLLTSFLFWSALYAIVYCVSTGKGKWTFLNQLLRGHYHMWYIFAIAGLYLLTPLLRKMTSCKATTEYFLASAFLFSFVLSRALAFISLFDFAHKDVLQSLRASFSQINPFGGIYAVFYYVLGFYLSAYPPRALLRRIGYLLGVGAFAAITLLTSWHTRINNAVSGYFYDPSTLLVLMMSAAVYLFFMQRFRNASFSGKRARILSRVSACSYGVYLMHPLILERLNLSLHLWPVSLWLSIPLTGLAIFAVALGISFALSCIAPLRRHIL